MLSASSLPLFPGALWPGMELPIRVLSRDKTYRFKNDLHSKESFTKNKCKNQLPQKYKYEHDFLTSRHNILIMHLEWNYLLGSYLEIKHIGLKMICIRKNLLQKINVKISYPKNINMNTIFWPLGTIYP